MKLNDFAIKELSKVFGPEVFDEPSDSGDPSTEWNRLTVRAVLELIEKFESQGHSGLSANVCISLFSKLAKYEPLSPLTGEDDEWTQVTDDLWQNQRCFRVFKGPDGQAYDLEGKIFVEADGSQFTSFESRVPVVFPYTPTREFVRV